MGKLRFSFKNKFLFYNFRIENNKMNSSVNSKKEIVINKDFSKEVLFDKEHNNHDYFPSSFNLPKIELLNQYVKYKYLCPDYDKFSRLFGHDSTFSIQNPEIGLNFQGHVNEYLENMKKYHFGNFELKNVLQIITKSNCVGIHTQQFRLGFGIDEPKGLYQVLENDYFEFGVNDDQTLYIKKLESQYEKRLIKNFLF